MSKQDLTVQKVLEVKKLKLSIEHSAAKLGIASSYLKKFILKNNIKWKGVEKKKIKRTPRTPRTRKIDPNSDFQQCKKLGVNYWSVKYRQNFLGLTFDDAVAVVLARGAK